MKKVKFFVGEHNSLVTTAGDPPALSQERVLVQVGEARFERPFQVYYWTNTEGGTDVSG